MEQGKYRDIVELFSYEAKQIPSDPVASLYMEVGRYGEIIEPVFI